jgi:hypothetical protein
LTYSPNFEDPRTRRRLERARGFAVSYFSETQPRTASKQLIDRYFGNTNRTLGRWLLATLLEVDDPHYNMHTGKPRSYRLRPTEPTAEELTSAKPRDLQECVNLAYEEHREALDQGRVEYREKSSRLWHPVQNMRTQYRRPFLAQSGLCFHYDICAAAPTILVQQAESIANDPKRFPLIRAYIQHRTLVRQMLARGTHSEPEAIKRTINALFCGAPLGVQSDRAVMQILQSTHRVQQLQQSRLVTELRREIRDLWRVLGEAIPRTTTTDRTGRSRRRRLTGRDKWQYYFAQELKVIRAVESLMRKSHTRVFLEHDGWVTSEYIDPYRISQHIRKRTGIRVEIELELFEDQLDADPTLHKASLCSSSKETSSFQDLDYNSNHHPDSTNTHSYTQVGEYHVLHP